MVCTALHIHGTKTRVKGAIKIVFFLFLSLALLFVSVNKSYAQAQHTGKRQGVYLGGQKGWNFLKSRKKYKHIKNKKRRKALSRKNNFSRKRTNYKRKKRFKYNKKHSAYKRNGRVRTKNSKLGKSGSLYSYNKKKARKRKGKFPKSKSQLTPKLSVYASTGLIFTGNEEKFNLNGELVNVYSNYKVSPHFTAGAHYNMNSNLAFGADIRGFRIRSNQEVGVSSNLQVNTLAISPYIKYNFVSIMNKFSPYVVVGPSFTFTQIQRGGTERTEEGVNIDTDTLAVEIVKIVFKESAIETDWTPLIGVKLGVGADFKIAKRITGFVQADLDFSSSRNSKKILEVFNKNEADYLFYGLSFGVKYQLFQNSSLY